MASTDEGFTDAELTEMLTAPRRIRGDQGEVEHRSISEVIQADQYLRKTRRGNRHLILRNSVVQVTQYPPE